MSSDALSCVERLNLTLRAGIRQGDPCSPLLLAIVSHFFFDLFSSNGFDSVAFADDIAIKITSFSPAYLEILHDLFDQIRFSTGLKINYKKTKLVRPRELWDPGGFRSWDMLANLLTPQAVL